MTTPVKHPQKDNSYSLSTRSRNQKKNSKEPIMGYTWAPIPVLSSNATKRVEGDDTQPMGFVLGPVEKKTTKKPVQKKNQDAITTGERNIIKLVSVCDLDATQLEQFEVMQLMMETVLSHFSIKELQELFCSGSAQESQENGEYMAKLETIVQINNYHITRVYIRNGLLCLLVCHDVSEPGSVEKLLHPIVPDFNGSASQDSGAEATSTTPVVGFESQGSMEPISGNDSEEKTLPYGFSSPTSYQQPGTVSSSVLDGLSGTNSLKSTHEEPEIDDHTAKFYERLNSFWSSPDGPNKTINQPGALSGSWLRNKNVSKIPVYKNEPSSKKKQSVLFRPLPQIPEALPKANKGKGVATQPERRIASEKSTGTVVRKSPIIGFRPKRRADVGVATEAQLDLFWGPDRSNRRVVSHVGNKGVEAPKDTAVPSATATTNSGRSNPRIFLTEINERNRSITWESVERPIQTRGKPTPGRTDGTSQQITSPSAPGIITRTVSMEVVRPLRDASMGQLFYNPRKFTSLTNLRRRSSTQSLLTTRTFNTSASLGKATEKPTGIPSPVAGGSYRQYQTRSQRLLSDLTAAKTDVSEEESGTKVDTPRASPEDPTQEYTIVTPTLCQSTRRGARVSNPEWS